ncbi:MAG TPA: NFACT RNA binding domain-containing protein, partial [Gemmatimonadota bacterium]|nr:NFACT RNA binding domain-containing protein [Gemmatimonadota bacterium]
RERAAQRLPDEIGRVRRRAAQLEQALERLAETGPDEELWDLAGGRPAPEGTTARGRETGRLPYRVYRSSGGLEIRVGRGARQNDELTFHHSHTEDIWLHARQVPGAHVILRWGRKDENPPRRDLLEAAVAAAVHSEARHSGTVGVDWTRRKYVRSPRKAPPGVVLPERVQTVFVEPSEAVLKRLGPDG